jgi:hypothetical protein
MEWRGRKYKSDKRNLIKNKDMIGNILFEFQCAIYNSEDTNTFACHVFKLL